MYLTFLGLGKYTLSIPISSYNRVYESDFTNNCHCSVYILLMTPSWYLLVSSSQTASLGAWVPASEQMLMWWKCVCLFIKYFFIKKKKVFKYSTIDQALHFGFILLFISSVIEGLFLAVPSITVPLSGTDKSNY